MKKDSQNRKNLCLKVHADEYDGWIYMYLACAVTANVAHHHFWSIKTAAFQKQTKCYKMDDDDDNKNKK